MPSLIDLTGKIFQNLQVVSKAPSKNRSTRWVCKCLVCGKIVERKGQDLKKSIDCGCGTGKRISEALAIHGETNTRLFKVWQKMKERCNNPNAINYERYGARGITFCSEWNSFQVFREWALSNGYSDQLQLNRINNDLGYCPENCNFVTPYENSLNKRNSVLLKAFGETKPLLEWVKDLRCAVCLETLRTRVNSGWEHETAITKPPREWNAYRKKNEANR